MRGKWLLDPDPESAETTAVSATVIDEANCVPIVVPPSLPFALRGARRNTLDSTSTSSLDRFTRFTRFTHTAHSSESSS